MEHNFNPNKGDYKYILEEEQRKETGEVFTTPVSTKTSFADRFRNWIIVRLLSRLKRTDRLKISFPLFLEFFC